RSAPSTVDVLVKMIELKGVGYCWSARSTAGPAEGALCESLRASVRPTHGASISGGVVRTVRREAETRGVATREPGENPEASAIRRSDRRAPDRTDHAPDQAVHLIRHALAPPATARAQRHAAALDRSPVRFGAPDP